MDVEQEIKNIERESARLLQKKQELQRIRDEEKVRQERLSKLFAESGYATPLEFVEALIRKYELKITGENAFLHKRKRTRITCKLRDAILKECNSGMSMNKASKKFDVSYAVVTKVLAGHYNNLKA